MRRKPFVLMSVFTLILMTLFITPVLAQGDLNPQALPAEGRVNLTAGFAPDPYGIELTSNGAVDVTYIAGCRGFATAEPNFTVNWSGEGEFLRFFFVSATNADTTIVVSDPRGRWHCSDNSFETTQPTINMTRPRAGEYKVWIGNVERGDSSAGCFYVTQSQVVNPIANTLPGCEASSEPVVNLSGTSFLDRLFQLHDLGASITQVAFAPRGGWVILYNQNEFYSQDIPSSALDTLTQLQNDGSRIDHIAFTQSGGWAIIFDGNGYWIDGIPQRALDALVELNSEGVSIRLIEFYSDDGWVIIYNDYDYWYRSIPTGASDQIEEIYGQQLEIRWVSFTNDGDWVIFYGANGYYSAGLPQTALDILTEMNTDGEDFNMIAFDANENWAVLFNTNDFWAFGFEQDQ